MKECKHCGHEARPDRNECLVCNNFRKRHGFTLTRADRTRLNAEPWCHICGSKDKLHVDHDHKTNKVRHYLCHTCNRGLGYFKDDPTLLQNAINYVVQQEEE